MHDVRHERHLLSRYAGPLLIALGGLVLVVLGLTGWGGRDGSARTDVGINAGAGDRGDIRAHNSPSLARHPRDRDRLAVAARIDTPRFSCTLHATADGGRTWRPVRVPLPEGERKCFAPDVVFAADGTLHFSFVTLRGRGNVPSALWVASSTDGGRTLGPARRVAGELAFQARLAADPSDARRLYLTWVQADEVGPLRFPGPGNPIVVARSDDAGQSWDEPRPLSAPERERVLAPVPEVAGDGTLYVLFLDVGDDRLDYEGGHDATGGPPYSGRFSLVLARSREGGREWEESVADDAVVPTERFIAFLPPAPSLAIGADGALHAAFHDARAGDADAWVWTLPAGAAEWRDPVRVNDDGHAGAQYLPQIDAAGDRLDVAYYDRRGDPGGSQTEVSLQSSHDGGRSFTERVRASSESFDGDIGAGAERGMPDHGSRIGLASDTDRVTVAWSDTRAGTEASNKQDLRAAAVRPARPGDGTARALMAAAGAALIVLAAGLAVRARRRATDAFG